MANLSNLKPMAAPKKGDIFKADRRRMDDTEAFAALTSSLSDMLGAGNATTARAVAR